MSPPRAPRARSKRPRKDPRPAGVRLTIYISEEQARALEQIGQREDRSMSYIARRALTAEIERCDEVAA